MKTKTTVITTVIIIAFNLGLLLLIYPSLPDKLSTHWDLNGVVNGYMDKNIAFLFIPILIVLLTILLLVLPKIDPLAKNIKQFQNTLNIFIIGLCIFLFYIQDIIILINLGYQINITQFLIPALAGLFYLVGILIEKAEPNYTIGIRTPWTLASNVVWYKTHKLGGKLYKLSAILSLIGLFWPIHGFIIFLITIIGTSLFLVFYSYTVYHKFK